MVSSPVIVNKGSSVIIAATISGPKSCYGERGKAEVKSGRFTVKLHDKGLDYLVENTNGTSRTTGQFHQIFISDVES
jgi:hypothetical protein